MGLQTLKLVVLRLFAFVGCFFPLQFSFEAGINFFFVHDFSHTPILTGFGMQLKTKRKHPKLNLILKRWLLNNIICYTFAVTIT